MQDVLCTDEVKSRSCDKHLKVTLTNGVARLHSPQCTRPNLSSALAFAAQGARQPVKAFIETIARGGARRLDVPLAAPHVAQS